jgi:4-hydroxy-2-oxoheptanedioate aldolase
MRRVTLRIEPRSEGTAENAKAAKQTVPGDLCDLRGFFWTLACLIAAATLSAQAPAKRINRAVELLEQGQPIYYTGSHEGTDGSFEQGVKDAQTWADYISYDMEHAPFDVKGLAEYMRGLAQGGPTRSGHRTPAVIVNVPVNGTDDATVRANAWMFQQVLATGVHGILLCHADTPGAVRAFVEAVRFPANGGRRGVHGNPTAARIWGISADDYAEKADVWPLNPKGELLLGLKLEDKYALESAEANTRIPGVAFAEWGPGDMAFSLGVKNGPGPMPAAMQAARAKVLAATKASKIFFLNTVTPDNVVDMIKEGVMIGTGSQRAAELGRAFTKRTMPW